MTTFTLSADSTNILFQMGFEEADIPAINQQITQISDDFLKDLWLTKDELDDAAINLFYFMKQAKLSKEDNLRFDLVHEVAVLASIAYNADIGEEIWQQIIAGKIEYALQHSPNQKVDLLTLEVIIITVLDCVNTLIIP